MTQHGDNITLARRELIAKLAAVANRMSKQHSRKGEEGAKPTVGRIAYFITECGTEFDLSNDEQILFLKYVVCGSGDAEELLKGDF